MYLKLIVLCSSNDINFKKTIIINFVSVKKTEVTENHDYISTPSRRQKREKIRLLEFW